MNRERQSAARAKHCAEQVRARPQMRDSAQELQRVTLLLQRVTGFRPADQLDARSAQFPLLARRGRRDQSALDHHGGSGREVSQVLRTRRARIHHDLQAGEARAVVEFKE